MKLLTIITAFAVLAAAHRGGRGGDSRDGKGKGGYGDSSSDEMRMRGDGPPKGPEDNKMAPPPHPKNDDANEMTTAGHLGGEKYDSETMEKKQGYKKDGTPCDSSDPDFDHYGKGKGKGGKGGKYGSSSWDSSDEYGYSKGCFFFKGFIIALIAGCFCCCLCKKLKSKGRCGRKRRCCGCRRKKKNSQTPNTVAMPRVVAAAETTAVAGETVTPGQKETPGKDAGITAVVVDYEDSIESQENNKDSHVV